jgi:hypothetical protein
MKITTIGLDIAKNVWFAACVLTESGNPWRSADNGYHG